MLLHMSYSSMEALRILCLGLMNILLFILSKVTTIFTVSYKTNVWNKSVKIKKLLYLNAYTYPLHLHAYSVI